LDKASKTLENLTAPQPQLPIGYQRLSSNPFLVGKEINLDSSLAHPALLEHESLVSVPDQSLVEKSIDLALPSVVHYVPEESGDHTALVLLVSLDSHELKRDTPILVVQQSPSL